MPSKQKALTECPECGCTDIFLEQPGGIVYELDTGKIRPVYSPLEAVCNWHLEHKFWYYPRTGRITRRSST